MVLKARKKALSKAEQKLAKDVMMDCLVKANGDISLAKALFNRHPDIVGFDIATVVLLFKIGLIIIQWFMKLSDARRRQALTRGVWE